MGVKKILLVLGAVILLVVIGGGVYLWWTHANDFRVVSASDDGYPPNEATTTGTWNVHLVLANGTTIAPPATANEMYDESFVGAESPVIGDDHRTVGWEAMYTNQATSYSIPLAVVIWRDGKVIQEISEEAMVWNWNFVQGTDQVAILWGPTHGDYYYAKLYDVISGKPLEEVDGAITSSSPQWAQLVSTGY